MIHCSVCVVIVTLRKASPGVASTSSSSSSPLPPLTAADSALLVLIGVLLRQFIGRMAGHVLPQDIVRRVASSPGGSSPSSSSSTGGAGGYFGEFKDVMISMIGGYSADKSGQLLLRSILVSDLKAAHKRKYRRLVSNETL